MEDFSIYNQKQLGNICKSYSQLIVRIKAYIDVLIFKSAIYDIVKEKEKTQKTSKEIEYATKILKITEKNYKEALHVLEHKDFESFKLEVTDRFKRYDALIAELKKEKEEFKKKEEEEKRTFAKQYGAIQDTQLERFNELWNSGKFRKKTEVYEIIADEDGTNPQAVKQNIFVAQKKGAKMIIEKFNKQEASPKKGKQK